MTKSRIKRVLISPQVLMRMFAIDSSWKEVKGIPSDATMRGFTIDPLTQTLNLFVYHDSFPEIDIEMEVAKPLETLFRKL